MVKYIIQSNDSEPSRPKEIINLFEIDKMNKLDKKKKRKNSNILKSEIILLNKLRIKYLIQEIERFKYEIDFLQYEKKYTNPSQIEIEIYSKRTELYNLYKKGKLTEEKDIALYNYYTLILNLNRKGRELEKYLTTLYRDSTNKSAYIKEEYYMGVLQTTGKFTDDFKIWKENYIKEILSQPLVEIERIQSKLI